MDLFIRLIRPRVRFLPCPRDTFEMCVNLFPYECWVLAYSRALLSIIRRCVARRCGKIKRIVRPRLGSADILIIPVEIKLRL